MPIEDGEHIRDVHESIILLLEGETQRPHHPLQSKSTICRVPGTLRDLNPTAYAPQIISIGPLHREDLRLKAMEEHKVTYMLKLFQRIDESTDMNVEHILRKCVQAMFGLVTRTRACYAESFKSYDDSRLAEMMLIDGCFILELLYRFQYPPAEGDPIFDNILVAHGIKNDLLLLENQIPFFVLEILFRLTVKHFLNNTSLTDLVLNFLKDMNIIKDSKLILTNETMDHGHILGLFQSCYGGNHPLTGGIPTISYSATEIDVAGVKFKAQTDGDSLLAVEFKKSSFLPWLITCGFISTNFKLPVLCIMDSTPSLLRNLIAYEQCYPWSRQYVTSFAFLMYKLIDNNNDVKLLGGSKIIQHHLGASEDVTNLFNNICNGVVPGNIYYTEEWTKLNEYCHGYWPSMWIWLRRLYRSTKWKTITVIAAMLIFLMTLFEIIHHYNG
ncbi:hypothetical protein E3N88_35583 [Mikania micrantha]|uniref:Uncharacterized protein n=1 Tax=Mikania micrantha TaxID=192012 RepID=A0A5N6M444_9ASTR|nr:hypothetical protein E3N88_35583 [Mikania micrantha]